MLKQLITDIHLRKYSAGSRRYLWIGKFYMKSEKSFGYEGIIKNLQLFILNILSKQK